MKEFECFSLYSGTSLWWTGEVWWSINIQMLLRSPGKRDQITWFLLKGGYPTVLWNGLMVAFMVAWMQVVQGWGLASLQLMVAFGYSWLCQEGQVCHWKISVWNGWRSLGMLEGERARWITSPNDTLATSVRTNDTCFWPFQARKGKSWIYIFLSLLCKCHGCGKGQQPTTQRAQMM